jgi:hypothetical protein
MCDRPNVAFYVWSFHRPTWHRDADRPDPKGETANIDTRTLTIEILAIGERGEVALMVGDLPAEICEPHPNILEKGFVVLGTPDIDGSDWEELTAREVPGLGMRDGFTDDPRLVDIGKQVRSGRSPQLKPGTVIPSLEK